MSHRLHAIALETNHEDADLLRRCLAALGTYRINFSHLPRANRAIERLRRSDADLLFIDYDLPTVTGLELIDAARTAGEQRPIIATAAEDCGHLAADLIRAGADGYLAKRDCHPGFVGPLLDSSLQLARQRTTQLRLRREAAREMMRSRGRSLTAV
ncbi:MAG: response regulator [Planctomycetota bacterium]